jgi:hypothetical protein
MARFLLHNHHAPEECAVTFAAFKGHQSPLRRGGAACSCLTGGHEIWWFVETESPESALALLPPYVSTRSTATRIKEVRIP